MPSASPSALAAPLYELRDLVGSGWPAHDPAVTILDGAHTALSDIAAAIDRSWARTADGWAGVGAAAAADFTAGTAAEAAGLANRAQVLSAAARQAGSAVADAGARLQAIIDRFEARAAALAPHLDEPGAVQELQAEAQRAVGEASAVVEELRAELDRQASAVIESAPGTPSAGMSGRSAGVSAGLGGFAPGSAGMSAGPVPAMSTGGWTPGTADFRPGSEWAATADRAGAAVGLSDPGMFGDGVAVRLPDGSSALAPNAVAASAVRHALTQLGVPYRWGGTTPGVGLDCSGLTQWAYHEAGLDIPRLAQEQDIGRAVSAGSLRPGDLAVWDGHVAMVVGAGTMIEAGDPVKLSPVRTTNAGQGFQGFWRPTG
ncbi:cell wall-associated NlpC family hydrolase [Mycobacterium frederiksbergense]|uniref:Cell wall-associated NlpC family hydrolase n=1 Tax=Mycolicibacterium frederiksbergense TaxID=117567 RepID=A0ABT6L1P6_9MYCO|nr:NlpC/P60 family protein [Mycolicibacterium frederiksbergense]MDH6196872.1 cell wall-associated NlpC family hydrolase [Mycolicibacterium frederiksbergense]